MAQTLPSGIKTFDATDNVTRQSFNDNFTVIDAKVQANDTKIGTLASLSTTNKTNVVAAINELFQSASDGKTAVASAITGMGQTASGSDTFAQLAAKIKAISNDANAAVGDVLVGKTFWQGGTKKTGTMANYSSGSYAAGGSAVSGTTLYLTPPSNGYYSTASNITIASANFTAANIKTGVNIFGITGNFTSDANAAAGDVISGKTAYVNGAKLTGTIANNGAGGTVTPGTSTQTKAAGYYSSAISIAGDANLIAANIRSGKSIFGVAGTVIEGKRWAQGTATVSSSTATFLCLIQGSSVSLKYVTGTGLTFTPSRIIVSQASTTYGQNMFVIYNNQGFNGNGGSSWNIVFGNENAVDYTRTNAGFVEVSSTRFQLPIYGLSPQYGFIWFAVE